VLISDYSSVHPMILFSNLEGYVEERNGCKHHHLHYRRSALAVQALLDDRVVQVLLRHRLGRGRLELRCYRFLGLHPNRAVQVLLEAPRDPVVQVHLERILVLLAVRALRVLQVVQVLQLVPLVQVLLDLLLLELQHHLDFHLLLGVLGVLEVHSEHHHSFVHIPLHHLHSLLAPVHRHSHFLLVDHRVQVVLHLLAVLGLLVVLGYIHMIVAVVVGRVGILVERVDILVELADSLGDRLAAAVGDILVVVVGDDNSVAAVLPKKVVQSGNDA